MCGPYERVSRVIGHRYSYQSPQAAYGLHKGLRHLIEQRERCLHKRRGMRGLPEALEVGHGGVAWAVVGKPPLVREQQERVEIRHKVR